jgi:hypothetical protein
LSTVPTDAELKVLAAYGREVRVAAIAMTQGITDKDVRRILNQFGVYDAPAAAKQLAERHRPPPPPPELTDQQRRSHHRKPDPTPASAPDATWQPAKQGDTPGELVPGEADLPLPVDLARLLADAQAHPQTRELAHRLRRHVYELQCHVTDVIEHTAAMVELDQLHTALAPWVAALQEQFEAVRDVGTVQHLEAWAVQHGHPVGDQHAATIRAYLDAHKELA